MLMNIEHYTKTQREHFRIIMTHKKGNGLKDHKGVN